jgi:acylphosphatase
VFPPGDGIPGQTEGGKEPMPAKRYWVTGRVQGVWFRASTRDRAADIGLDGWVRNLADGRVEVLASGTDGQIEELETFLRQGPPGARVDLVEDEATDPPEGRGFHIER